MKKIPQQISRKQFVENNSTFFTGTTNFLKNIYTQNILSKFEFLCNFFIWQKKSGGEGEGLISVLGEKQLIFIPKLLTQLNVGIDVHLGGESGSYNLYPK